MQGLDAPKLMLVAIDTNVLINRADDNEDVIDCIETIRRRLTNPKIIVLPTVILELLHISECHDPPEKALAKKALLSVIDPWHFQPINYIPAGHGIVEQIGRKIREKGLIPEEEVHDSNLIAEAALCGATILVSSDSHIKNIDQQMLKIQLDAVSYTHLRAHETGR